MARLTGSRYDGYLYRPVPSDLDDDVRVAVEAYRASSPEDRLLLHQNMVGEPVDVLESFAERQAVVAVRTGSIEPIRLGLVALGMAFPKGDHPQAVMALAKLDYSARLLGADLASVAAEVAEVLPDDARSALAQFLARDDRHDSLLARMGFAAYGSGPDFIYDNASALPASSKMEGSAPAPQNLGGVFVMRERYTTARPWDPVAIRVKDGAIVTTDRLAQRRAFPLDDPDAPQRVVRYFQPRGRVSRSSHWALTDGHGQAILSGSEDDWNPDDFARLAEAAGLHFAPEGLAPRYQAPPHRKDYVDVSADRTSAWITLSALLLLLLTPFSLVGLWSGYPWLWALQWSITGAWYLLTRIREEAIIVRNCAALPPEESPATERHRINRSRAVLGLAGFGLGPPLLVYLLHSAPPLP